MDISILRSWWAQRQGLDGSLVGAAPAAVLERSGWARSVGGSAPYLTMWSRAGCTREAMDQSVTKMEIHELPAARGCTYVVPASDFSLALRVAAGFSSESEMKTAIKLGVTEAEVEKLCRKVVDVLAGGAALDPDGIREATGNASRSLGPEGIKKGMASTLPLALGRLQIQGEIRRIPTNGRLDQQRYRYARWPSNPLAGVSQISREEAYTELARRFFRWIGPATLAEFQWFSALGVKASKAAIEPLGLVSFEDARLMFADDLDGLMSHKVSKTARYVLASSLDAMVLLRRDHKTLVDEADLNMELNLEKGCATLGSITDLPSHPIFDRGRVVGLWEFDTSTQTIAWMSFVKKNKALEAAVAEAEAFVRDQLGDARSFSLDSPQSRVPRVNALRALGKK